MSRWEVDGREVTSHSLWRVIEDFENGQLSATERDELIGILEESRRARAIYLEYCELSALLQIKAATQAEEGMMPVVNDRRGQRRVLRWSVLAAAAVIALFAGLATFIQLSTTEPATVALEASSGSVWNIVGGREDDAPEISTLTEGSSLHLSSGTVILTLESGTRLVAQGPARIRFPKLEEPVIEEGWLWADTGSDSTELYISTTVLRFRDIGTRFGIRVRDDRKAELHVIEGIVEVLARKTGESTKVLPGRAGVAIGADGGMEGISLAADPFPGLPALLEASPRYATTILGQAPSGYWRLDEAEVGDIANEVAGAAMARYAQSSNANVAGVRPSPRLRGFEQGNMGAHFPGADVQSLIYHLDPGSGISPVEGAVSFWFRRNADIEAPEVLWYAGAPGGRGMGPEPEIHAFLSKVGQVRFFIEAGKEDVLLSSEAVVTDGQWHHVVASWKEHAVDLFLDGKRVARDSDYESAGWESIKGNNVRFGKTGSSQQTLPQDLHYFRGWADEIAVWDRALTEMEATLQYEAAVGSGS